MDGSVVQTWMSDILHAITQGLLIPDIVLLIGFIAYALFCIGSIIVEFFTERRHFKVVMPKFLAALMAAKEDEVPKVIEESGLLKRQKEALLTVYDYRVLPGDALIALIRRLVSEEESRYDRISGRNNMAARVSPMLGLMGTLIPLGPGIQALGTANTELLSDSLLIAFDTTVAGLVVAAVCMVIGKIRSIWYGNYMSALDSGMATMLQKIEDMRAEGKIVTKEPSNYAFLFGQGAAGGKKDKKADKGKKTVKADKATMTVEGKKTDSFAPVGKPSQPGVGAISESSRDWRSTVPAYDASASASASNANGQPFQSTFAGTGTAVANAANPPASAQPKGSALDELSRLVAESASEPASEPLTQAAEPSAQATGSLPFVSQAAAPADSFANAATAPAVAQQPLTPLQASASFAPVPDPAFISDLQAAAVVNPIPASAPAVYPAPMAEPFAQGSTGIAANVASAAEATSAASVAGAADTASAAPAFTTNPIPPISQAGESAPETAPAKQTSGWYQPRLHNDEN